MSILSALSENRHDKKNLAELAKLPQALIMQMGQRKELTQEEVAMVISKKAEAIESAARQKALEQGGGQMPSVMEQDMMKVAQAENPAPQQMMPQQMAQQLPEDVGIAQNPVPPMQMAGGGIIAFDEGGDVDLGEEDDYQDLIDQAEEDAVIQEMYDLTDSMEDGADVGIRSGENKNIMEDTRGRAMGDKGDLESRLRAQIMSKESGGRRYDKNGNLLTSSKGALGEMQVMPATARDPGFGIKAARDNSPEELRRVGDEYVGILLNRYQDPKLAMIAYNMGPGATDKWLASGADIKKLPKETQGYIRGVNLAQGGEVKHYAAGDFVDDTQYDPISGLPVSGYETYSERSSEREMPSEYFMDLPAQRKVAKEQNIKASSNKSRKAVPKDEKTFEDIIAYSMVPTAEQESKAPAGGQFSNTQNAVAKADEDTFNLMKYIQAQQAKRDKAAESDKWQAGLAAGLGMLGGTSQYAFENIGKGGQAGVQQLAQLQKMRASQDIASDKLFGTASNQEMANRYRKDVLAQGKDRADDDRAQRLLTAKNTHIDKVLKDNYGMDRQILGQLKLKQSMGKITPEEIQKLNFYERTIRDVERDAERKFASGTGGMKLVGVR